MLASISDQIHAMDGKIDCHLMVENPSKHFGAFARAGADSVTFHYEAVRDVRGCVQAAREHDLEVGLAFNPGTPVAEAVATAENVDVGTALARISPELRVVLQLTVIDGLSTREAAVLLDIPRGTVKSRLQRARATLREEMA